MFIYKSMRTCAHYAIACVLILSSVTGCAEPSPPVITADHEFCDFYTPLYLTEKEWSSLSEERANAVDLNNAMWLEFCVAPGNTQ